MVERGRSPVIEREVYGEDDARSMSPRRNSEELEKIGREAKATLEQQAKTLQSGLLALLDRVDKVREEHDKLEGENRFLQEYIGSLMATSKITGDSGAGTRNRNSTSRLK
jgi:phage shock protein A